MIQVNSTGVNFGDVPYEYTILPIGFISFQRDHGSGEFSIIGLNQRGKILLDKSGNELLDQGVGLLHSDFAMELERTFKTKANQEAFLSILQESKRSYYCDFIYLDNQKIYCFFSTQKEKPEKRRESPEKDIYAQQTSFKNLFHTFFHHVPVGIVLINQQGKIEDVSYYFTELFGYNFDEILSRDIDDFIIPPELREEAVTLTDMALNGEIIKYETKRIAKDGRVVYVLIQAAPIIQDDVQQGVFLIYQDFTPQKLALERVKETGRKLEELHRVVHQLDACETEDEVYQVAVEAAEKILFFNSCIIVLEEEGMLKPKTIAGSIPIDKFPTVKNDAGIVGKTYQTGKTFYYGNLKREPMANVDIGLFKSVLTVPIGKLGVFQAISDQQDAYTKEDMRLAELLVGHTEDVVNRIKLKERLYYQANYDALTGLINRHHFNQLLDREVERAKRNQSSLTFLMIDVDNFKNINDTLGHLAGDNVLKEIAALVNENVRKCDYVVRYGGDEFLVIMTEMCQCEIQEHSQMVIQRLKDALNQWCLEQEEDYLKSISISIGAAHWHPNGDQSIREVLYQADVWMYSDKHIEE